MKATIAGEAVPDQISSLYPSVRPAVERAGSDETAVTKANAGKSSLLCFDLTFKPRESSGNIALSGDCRVSA